MKKSEFIKKFAKEADLSQKDAKEILAILGKVVVECMKDEDGVTPFTGMKFISEYREPHIARNPSTGETINVAGKYRPKVKFGATVKEALNS